MWNFTELQCIESVFVFFLTILSMFCSQIPNSFKHFSQVEPPDSSSKSATDRLWFLPWRSSLLINFINNMYTAPPDL